MRSNKGITLISLISSVILIIILASLTISTSVDAYNQMKFEGAKAEIEQMQKLVDEITADFTNYSNTQSTAVKYVDYFKVRYKQDFTSKLLTAHQSEAKTIMDKFEVLKSAVDTSFYFTKDDIVKYFDLKGINDVVVDFNTRTVYSVQGIKNPDDKSITYYTQSDWGENPKIASNIPTSTAPTITITKKNLYNSTNNAKVFDIELSVNKKIGNITDIYATCVNAGKTSTTKISDFRVVTADADKETKTVIRVVVTGVGTYSFKISDDLGKTYSSGTMAIS